MKAIVQDRYGSPGDVLELREIEEPVVRDDEVLVRVHAASVHLGVWVLIRGVPYLMRAMTGLRAPRIHIPGTDVAGTVEAVGTDVTQLRPGDEVFGWCEGAFAEYVSARAGHFVARPVGLSFEQAAAVGVSAIAALQALRDRGSVRAGQKVLINGASGGVGTFAVQIARAFDAEVTGVCSTGSVDLVRSIGADHVIDYVKEDFTRAEARYDFILDNVGDRPLSECRRVLAGGGTVQPNGGGHVSGRWVGPFGHVLKSFVWSLFLRQVKRPFLSTSNREDLVALSALVEAGKVVPVIDRTYPLSEVAAAVGHVGEGHARGTTVITM